MSDDTPRPLEEGDTVRCHLLGEWRDGPEREPPDLNVGMVRMATQPDENGKQFVRVYWFQQHAEFGAHIVRQSGELFRTSADNVFERLEAE